MREGSYVCTRYEAYPLHTADCSTVLPIYICDFYMSSHERIGELHTKSSTVLVIRL